MLNISLQSLNSVKWSVFPPPTICVLVLLFPFQLLHCALSLAVQYIVIGPVCALRVCNERVACLWVCYHDNSKLRALIITKLVYR